MSPDQMYDRLAVLRRMLEQEFPSIRPLDDRSIAFDVTAGPIPINCYCEINPDAQALIRQHVPGLVKLSVGRPLSEALRAVGEDFGEGIILPPGQA